MNERKRQVLKVAQRLFIEKGFIMTSVQDIIDESGISKGTFYNYFSSKNECLLAILEHAREISLTRRREFQIGKDINDKKVLEKQIAIRYIVNKENNILPIYQAIFYAKDEDLKTYVSKLHLQELNWLAERITEVYGQATKSYALDCAVMVFGMLQHFLQVCKISSKEDFSLDTLIQYIMKRLDALLEDVQNEGDYFLVRTTVPSDENPIEDLKKIKVEVLTRLNRMDKKAEVDSKGKLYITFLIEELSAEQPRIYLLESVTRSFREVYENTSLQTDATELSYMLWRFLEQLNNDNE